MQLRLKTKFTLTTALLVLVVVALISTLFVARQASLVIGQAGERARLITQQVFLQSQYAINNASDSGAAPASSAPGDVRSFVKQALDENAGLTSLIESSVSYSPTIYEVAVVDHEQVVLLSSDESLAGRPAFPRPPLQQLAGAGFFEQVRALYGPPRVYEVALPFNIADHPFGEIRVGLSTALLRNEIAPELQKTAWLALGLLALSTLLAAGLSHVQLAPLSRISTQLDRIARGEFDAVAPSDLHKVGALSGDELGQVSNKITRIGEQLRGVQEIFGSLRENVEHVMAGMDDGLILFTPDARVALVSPSVEKFLGVPRQTLLGRRVSEVFPLGHPLQRALGIQGDQVWPEESVEIVRGEGQLGAVSRMSVSVHVITDRGPEPAGRMGALVTLRDLDSIERLGSHLETSERLSAMGRVTAGVAHEVKNPLNAMTTWLGVLKEKLPAAGDGERPKLAREALTVLESEIHRLDRVVKTFLDFTRPVEPEFADISLGALLEEVAAVARPQFQRAGVELVTTGIRDSASVRADPQLLKQAAFNLLLNAVEALSGVALQPPRKGRVEIALERRGDSAEFRIADNGPGIPADKRDKVFQLFFTTRKGGSGIGLATAYRIVQLHRGSIDFDSEPGRGATFRIRLPLLPGASRMVASDSAARLADPVVPVGSLPSTASPASRRHG